MKRIALATLVAAATAVPAISQRSDSPPPPALVVTGNAQIMAVPDEATVRLGIVRQATSAQVAQEQANAIGTEILNAIGKLGVPAQQIQTSRLILSPVYAPRGPDSRDAPRIVSYTASNVVSVRLQNLSQIGPVIDAGLKAGANQLEGVQFVEVTEGGVSFQPPQPYALSRVMAAQASDTITPVSPGEIEVHASVTVRYRIAPKP